MKGEDRKFILFLASTLLYALIIFLLSSQSSPPGTETGKSVTRYFDIFAHMGLYFVFSFLVYSTILSYPSKIKINRYDMVFSIVTMYGLSDEIHQMFIPNRFFSLKDLFFDALSCLVLLFFVWINKQYKIFFLDWILGE